MICLVTSDNNEAQGNRASIISFIYNVYNEKIGQEEKASPADFSGQCRKGPWVQGVELWQRPLPLLAEHDELGLEYTTKFNVKIQSSREVKPRLAHISQSSQTENITYFRFLLKIVATINHTWSNRTPSQLRKNTIPRLAAAMGSKSNRSKNWSTGPPSSSSTILSATSESNGGTWSWGNNYDLVEVAMKWTPLLTLAKWPPTAHEHPKHPIQTQLKMNLICTLPQNS